MNILIYSGLYIVSAALRLARKALGVDIAADTVDGIEAGVAQIRGER